MPVSPTTSLSTYLPFPGVSYWPSNGSGSGVCGVFPGELWEGEA